MNRIGKPHILVVPYPAQGHVIPLMELSQYLAKHGFSITFVNTQHNRQLIKNSVTSKPDIDSHISLVSIADGLQNSSGSILRVMPGKIEELLEEINASNSDKISCIVADQSFGWALELAEKKGIRRAAFCPAAAANLVLGFSIPKLIQDGIIDENGTPIKDQMIKLSPSMPAMKASNFVWACLGNIDSQKTIFALMVKNNKSMKLTDWLLCNSSYELEPAAFSLAPQILPIGPISASDKQGDSLGNFCPEDSTCLKWLDQQPPQSVVYVAFGSSTVLNPTQFRELALGLELSKRRFLWVVRPDITRGIDEIFLEDFEERVGNRGKIVGWAAQQKVVAHPSVSCFVSHCGWNSTMEGVINGIPFLCWPYFADQFLNQTYICDIWKIGIGFDRDENGLIVHEQIKNKVEKLLSNEELKTRALHLKEMVKNSVREGGSSHQNLEKFVDWIKEM